ncbi:hypothetical protein RB195_010504 [Necator americanus]|uniref:Mos1 transposase HTH domain-containing protein n=1 Tax=Necator americanus TaxID=51031 RepID=A0ABR1CY87_NECAM
MMRRRHTLYLNIDLEDAKVKQEQANKMFTSPGSSLDNEDLERTVLANPEANIRTLAEDLGVHHTTVVRHLAEIGKVKKMSKWVPHELTKE